MAAAPSSAPESPAPPASYPAAWLLGLFAAWTAIVALGLVQSALGMQAMGTPVVWRYLLLPRLLDLLLGGLFLPILLWLVRRPRRGGWLGHAAVLATAAAAFSVARTAGSALAEPLLLGPGVVFHGSRIAKGIGEFLSYGLLAGGVYALEFRRRLAERETQALQLQARLAEARLDALASQLRPHFLFNTLTAVSVLMHRDPAAADLMLTRLADLLRATLRVPAGHEISLDEEVALLDRYLEIMRVRYGPRLTVQRAIPPALGNARVPAFLLQPLVENALEHGIARRAGAGRVEIVGETVGGRLRLSVVDDGPGLAATRPSDGSEGVGLGNTRRRLRELYGDDQRLELESLPGAGTRAVVELPLRAHGAASPVGDGRRG